MCYAKPGPRCAGHTKKELAQAYSNYKEAVQEKDEIKTKTLEKKIKSVQREYYATPTGNKELRTYAEKHSKKDYIELADALQNEYKKKLVLVKGEPEELLPVTDKKEDQVVRHLRWDNIDTLSALEDSSIDPKIGGKQLEHFGQIADPNIARGNSQEIANIFSSFTKGESEYDDGLIEVTTISHKPAGDKIETHYANHFKHKNEDYVVDFSYSELDPNMDSTEWPSVMTVKEWRKQVDQVSIEGVPEALPPIPNPREGELPVFSSSKENTLLSRAELEPPEDHRDGTFTRFLSVNQIRVAAVRYHVEDGKPYIHSAETRGRYKNQGYMTVLMKKIATDHGVEKPYSSGSYTNQGYNYTQHLTQQQEGITPAINHPGYTDDEPFSFINDWVNR